MRRIHWLGLTALASIVIHSASNAQQHHRSFGPCLAEHTGRGCWDAACSDRICSADPACCDDGWGSVCAGLASFVCELDAQNVVCSDDFNIRAARLLQIGTPQIGTLQNAPLVEEPLDLCCGLRDTGPSMRTVWYRLHAPDRPIDLRMHALSEVDGAAFLQILASDIGGPLDVQCASLSPHLCAAADLGLGEVPTIRTAALTPGQLYFVRAGGSIESNFMLMLRELDELVRPENDECDDALPIIEGATTVDANGATAACDDEFDTETLDRDVWLNYHATCDGWLELWGESDGAIEVYEGCACPQRSDRLIGRLDTLRPRFVDPLIPVRRASCYLLRLSGSAQVELLCLSENECPPLKLRFGEGGAAESATARSNTTDPRQPQESNPELRLATPNRFRVRLTQANRPAPPHCWQACQSSTNQALYVDAFPQLASPIWIDSVDRIADDEFEIVLGRPVRPGEWTKIDYLSDDGPQQIVWFASLPGDLTRNGSVDGQDSARIERFHELLGSSPLFDINRDGRIGPPDITAAIDLLNGSGPTGPWFGARLDLDFGPCEPN